MIRRAKQRMSYTAFVRSIYLTLIGGSIARSVNVLIL